MTPQQTQNRALRREQVERYLATDMTVKEWCGLNQVSESTMYRWMSRFRREEPGMFADPTHGEWVELSRASVAARTALAVRAADEEPGPKPEPPQKRAPRTRAVPRRRWWCGPTAPTSWSPRASPRRT